MEENRNLFMETEPVGKLLAKFAIPCVISLLIAALYNIVDQLFIANASYLGSNGNAGNTVVFPLTIIALAFAMMLGDGCCTLVASSLGSGRSDSAHKAVGTTVIATIVCGLIIMGIYLIFADPILRAFGADVNEKTFEFAREYFFWIALGIPFYMFGQAMNSVIRSDGSPTFAMVILLIGAVLNLIFDPICIYGLKWGMMGAALATIFGQIVAAIISAVYLCRMKAVKLCRDSFRFRPSLLKTIIPRGATSFLSQISIVISMFAVINMTKKYGLMDAIFGQEEFAQIPTAVIGIVMKFYQIIISISVGMACGCMAIGAYNYGAKRFDRVKKLMRILLMWEVIIGAAASIIFLLIPKQMIGIFGAANESVYYTEFAVKAIRIYLCPLALTCFNKGTFIFLQSMGKVAFSTIITSVREIVFGAGLPILLPLFMGLDGVLWWMVVADVVTFVISVFILKNVNSELKQYNQSVMES